MISGKSEYAIDQAIGYLRSIDLNSDTKIKPVSKLEERHKKHLNEIEEKLARSKKAVQRNLLASHYLEKAALRIRNAKISSDLILEKEIASKQNVRSRKFIGPSLDDNFIKLIDASSESSSGTTFLILHHFHAYDDSQLLTQLNSLPKNVQNQITEGLFADIADFSSQRRITKLEATILFQKSLQFLQRKHANSNNNSSPTKNKFEADSEINFETNDTADITADKYITDISYNGSTSIDSKLTYHPEEMPDDEEVDQQQKQQQQSLKAYRETSNKNSHWNILVSYLRKKIFLISLSHQLIQRSPATHSKPLLYSLPEVKPPPATRSLLSISASSTTISTGTNKNKMNQKKQSLHKKSRRQTPQSNNLSEVEKLQLELSKSQKIQSTLTSNILSNMTRTSQGISFANFESAKKFTKNVSIQKIFNIIDRKRKKLYQIVFCKFFECIELFRKECQARTILKQMATCRMVDVISCNFAEKKNRYMQYFHQQMLLFRDCEEFAAVLEIQRFCRGFLVRLDNYHSYRNTNAIIIQKTLRAYYGRLKAQAYYQMYRESRAVRVIERVWAHSRWRRSVWRIIKLTFLSRKAMKIQKVYRGHVVRVSYQKMLLNRERNMSATTIQALWRKYKAIVITHLLRHHRKIVNKIKLTQKICRGFLARLYVKDLWERHYCAAVIQRSVRCAKARYVLRRLREDVAVLLIQRQVRRYLAGLLAKQLRFLREIENLKRNSDIEKINRIILGYRDRKNYLKMLSDYHKRCEDAATRIQQYYRRYRLVVEAKRVRRKLYVEMRQRLAREAIRSRSARSIQRTGKSYLVKKEIQRQLDEKKGVAAVCIQRRARGMSGRAKARQRQVDVEAALRRKKPLSAYYALQERYLRDQNLFHRTQVLILQCSFRMYSAKLKVRILRQRRAAATIGRACRRVLDTRADKAALQTLREERRRKERAATVIQSLIRGFLGRAQARRHMYVDCIKWFILRTRLKKITKGALNSFRKRKKKFKRAQAAATAIQSRVRGILSREKIRRRYKRLLKQREKRRYQKRWWAATKIQSIVRMSIAKLLVDRRRQLVERQRKRKADKEALDSKVAAFHDSYLTDLLAVRVQNGVREKLAREKLSEAYVSSKDEARQTEQRRLDVHATRIQALVRGIAGRKRCKKLIPALQRIQMIRSLCSECERTPAIRICRNCKDQFCLECFARLHRKGYRKKHDWYYVAGKDPVSVNNHVTATNNKSKPAGGILNLGLEFDVNYDSNKNKNGSRKDGWEEFFDEKSKKKYYFNSITGVTTWKKPY